MKYMADEMFEELPDLLRKEGIDCRTVYEWIDGKKQKTRTIEDWEIRKFLAQKTNQGEEITLITKDEDSWKQIQADGLSVIYVPQVIRDFILNREK
jgi:hypothetical protein